MLSRLLSDIRQFLQQCPELMFNERDFQMQLAVFLRLTRNYDDVDVEYFIPNSVAIEKGYEWKSDLRLDIVVRKGEKYAVVELKYHTRRIVKDIKRFNTLLPNVEVIKNHGAQDIVSYNFWKDVRRIEIIKALFPDNVEGGVAVMLTNDAYHLRGPRKGSICDAFSMADGRQDVHGPLNWTRSTATSKNLPPFSLTGKYSVKWESIEIDDNNFFYTLIII
ncbi:MAG: hypothetical protein SOU18_08835 [Alloprevotella sp.]|nr:hypothetical protein [Alloprevotella sp.]